MRWMLVLVLAVACVPTGDEPLPVYPERPRQQETLALILDAYGLGRPRLAIEWVEWSDCDQALLRHDGRCVPHAVDPGPVFRLRPAWRYSETPLPALICEHFLRDCPIDVTDRALNALYHAGL